MLEDCHDREHRYKVSDVVHALGPQFVPSALQSPITPHNRSVFLVEGFEPRGVFFVHLVTFNVLFEQKV